jgi:hypothetical protein
MDKRTELEKYFEDAVLIIVILFGTSALLTFFSLKFGVIGFMLFFIIALIIGGIADYMINR